MTRDRRSLLTLTETALILNVSKGTVQRVIRDGDLRVIRIGRRRFVHRDDLHAFIDKARARSRPRS